MRRPAIALTAFLAAIPGSADAQSPGTLSEPVTISFLTNPTDLIFIPATLADTIALAVILDTGAGVDVLAPSRIRQAGGVPAGWFTGFRMTGERLDGRMYLVPSLKVGPRESKNAMVVGWDLLDSLKLDGIISMTGFRHQPLTIDFVARTVTFESPRSLARRRSNGRVAPLQLHDIRGRALDLFAGFDFGGMPGDCLIDTGTPSSRAHLRYMAPLGIDTTALDSISGHGVVRRERRALTGVIELQYQATVPAVSLSGSPDVSVQAPRVTFSDIIYDCVIGKSFWEGRELTIDIEHQELIVSTP